MPISKQITNANGVALAFHKAKSATVDFTAGAAVVQVASWASAQAHDAGLPLAWMQPVTVLLGQLADVETALVQGNTPFNGGSIVPDATDTLDALRTRQWASVKADRDAADFGGFVWSGSTFDSDPLSQARITGSVLMAQIAAQNGSAFSVDWTLADNTVRTLSGADMIAVGLALGAHVQAVHDKGDALRAQIDQAADAAAVVAVVWTTP